MRRIIAVVCVSLAALTALGVFVDRRGLEDTAVASSAIVVLGARVQPDGTASPTLRARAEHGAAAFHRGLAPLIVFSGGVGENPPSEASVARDIAVSLGVPSASCVLEEDSHSTRENARFTAKILRERNLHDVVLVTDPYHMARARWLFEHEGLRVTASPVFEAPRHRSAFERAKWTAREAVSLVKDVVLTWL